MYEINGEGKEDDLECVGLINFDDMKDNNFVLEEWCRLIEKHKQHPDRHNCLEDAGSFKQVKRKYSSIIIKEYSTVYYTVDYVDPSLLNIKQTLFFDMSKVLLIEHGTTDSVSDGGDFFHCGVILKGTTDKSTVTNAIRLLTCIKSSEEVTTAPIGRAVMHVNGSTIYSTKFWLKLLVGR